MNERRGTLTGGEEKAAAAAEEEEEAYSHWRSFPMGQRVDSESHKNVNPTEYGFR